MQLTLNTLVCQMSVHKWLMPLKENKSLWKSDVLVQVVAFLDKTGLLNRSGGECVYDIDGYNERHE